MTFKSIGMRAGMRLVLLLSVLAAACGGVQSATPTVTVTTEAGTDRDLEPLPATATPTATLVPSPLPENTATLEAATATPDTAGGTSLALNESNKYGEPANVAGYRFSLRFHSMLEGADGSATAGEIVIEGARDVSGGGVTFTATASGTADFGSGQSLTYTRIDDTAYMVLPAGQCVSLAGAADDDLYTIFLADGGILGELSGAEPGEPPQDTVNGIPVDHYVFDKSDLNLADSTTPQVTEAEGHIFVARDGGYVVRVTMTGRGGSTLLNGVAGDGDITYELNYFDFDKPVTIEIPAGCPESVPATVPILPDASNVSTLSGVSTYSSTVSFATAVEFYRSEMAAADWELVQSIGAAPSQLLTFSREGSTVQVSIEQQNGMLQIGLVQSP